MEVIDKMDTDELSKYLYHLQDYTQIVRDINSVRKESEDALICLLHRQKDLSILALKEHNKVDQLARLIDEMRKKYPPKCPDEYVYKGDNEDEDEDEKWYL
jgi:hypothetical protein